MKEEEDMPVGLCGEHSSHLMLSPQHLLCCKTCFSARTEIDCTPALAPDFECCTRLVARLSLVPGSQLLQLQYVPTPLADMMFFPPLTGMVL